MYGFVRKIGMHRVDNSIKYYHQQMINNRMSTRVESLFSYCSYFSIRRRKMTMISRNDWENKKKFRLSFFDESIQHTRMNGISHAISPSSYLTWLGHNAYVSNVSCAPVCKPIHFGENNISSFHIGHLAKSCTRTLRWNAAETRKGNLFRPLHPILATE